MDVLVVCAANIARSPLAEALLAGALPPGLTASSAGTRARDGHPAADGSIALAEQRGLDLGRHRSRPVSAELVRDAELILTMSEQQRDTCARMATGASERTFTVRELAGFLDLVDLDVAPSRTAPRLRWLRERAHRARPRARPVLGGVDIADPMGRPWSAWLALGEQLDLAVGRITAALHAGPPPTHSG